MSEPQFRPLPKIAGGNMAEGARFENPTAPETIDLDLLLSFRSQSLTEIRDR